MIVNSELPKHLLAASYYQAKIKMPALKPSHKTCLTDRIGVFEDFSEIQKIVNLVNEFSSLWKLFNFMQIPPKK